LPAEVVSHHGRVPRTRLVGTWVRGRLLAGASGHDLVRPAIVAALALLLAPSALALALRTSFAPTDPLAPRQYYLAQDHAFDAFPAELPVLNPVRVAIIDSGLDGGHPEFPRSRIWQARSWVGGSALTDEEGHGTFVAGVIGAALNNNEGIA